MPARPNLLFIFSDQHRPDTLDCYGDTYTQTPNLDRLAAGSTVFENTYCTQPVCTPSRSSIMTGLFPHTTGCVKNNTPLKPETPSMGEMVSPEYLRAYVGKWHLGNEGVAQHGFEVWKSIEDKYYATALGSPVHSAYHDYLVAAGFTPDETQGPDRVFSRDTAGRMPEEHTKARFVGREAARVIREAGERPFVLYASFQEPHPPYFSPLEGLYDPAQIPVQATFRQRPPDDVSRLNQWLGETYLWGTEWYDIDMTTEAGWRQTRARYLGNVTLVDRAVGDILQALEASGQADRTIVVYTSDHGDLMGEHAQFGKGVMYEMSARIPLLVRVPWLSNPRQRVAQPVSQIDLVPTLLELLGEAVPAYLEGRSRAGVLTGAPMPEDDVFVEWNGNEGRRPSKFLPVRPGAPAWDWPQVYGPWRTLVSPDGYKLNLAVQDRCELFNLRADPDEQVNLFERPAERGRARDMTARVRAWQARTGDTAPLPEV